MRETVEILLKQQIEIKVLSGDSPQTVAAIARDVGIPLGGVRDGASIPEDPAERQRFAVDATVVGRISPEGKKAIVHALRHEGRYVAMIGDGVNDVPALKSSCRPRKETVVGNQEGLTNKKRRKETKASIGKLAVGCLVLVCSGRRRQDCGGFDLVGGWRREYQNLPPGTHPHRHPPPPEHHAGAAARHAVGADLSDDARRRVADLRHPHRSRGLRCRGGGAHDRAGAHDVGWMKRALSCSSTRSRIERTACWAARRGRRL